MFGDLALLDCETGWSYKFLDVRSAVGTLNLGPGVKSENERREATLCTGLDFFSFLIVFLL